MIIIKLVIKQQPMHNDKQEYVISIHEEEAIEAILNQTNTQSATHRDLDIEIEQILKESEFTIQQEYQLRADKQFAKNRLSLDFSSNKDYIQNSFLVDKGLGAFDESFATYSMKSGSRKSSQCLPDLESLDEVIVRKSVEAESDKEIYILEKFEKEELGRAKKEEEEVVKLDEMYPKINPMAMYRHQYPIFNFEPSSLSKYLRHKKLKAQDVTSAVTLPSVNSERWTIIAVADSLYLFVTDRWKEPRVMTPRKAKNITTICLSPEKNYLAVVLSTQIVVYQIKKEAGTIVLIKNFSELTNSPLTKVAYKKLWFGMKVSKYIRSFPSQMIKF